MRPLRVGDRVIRRRRLLKTAGTIVRVGLSEGKRGQVWIKWDHASTLPNPSAEYVDDLELVEHGHSPPA
jgi:hypothetical protein